MAMWCKASSYSILAFAVVTLVGCESRAVLGKVSGQVTFQGKAVANAAVLFSNAAQGVYITANADAEGRYAVEMAQGRGLPPGSYQITINPPPITPPTMSTGPLPKPEKLPEYPSIPKKYRDVKTSGLTLTVVEGDNRFDVNMTP